MRKERLKEEIIEILEVKKFSYLRELFNTVNLSKSYLHIGFLLILVEKIERYKIINYQKLTITRSSQFGSSNEKINCYEIETTIFI